MSDNLTSNGMGRLFRLGIMIGGSDTATQPPVERLLARRLHTLSSEKGGGAPGERPRRFGVAERYGCTSGSGMTPPFRI